MFKKTLLENRNLIEISNQRGHVSKIYVHNLQYSEKIFVWRAIWYTRDSINNIDFINVNSEYNTTATALNDSLCIEYPSIIEMPTNLTHTKPNKRSFTLQTNPGGEKKCIYLASVWDESNLCIQTT